LPNGGRHYNIVEGDEVERQLRDGDWVIFNRQPTLRLESMIAFRVKIVSGDAFRLNEIFTRAYNAD
jgi:DNA-directed RNA polymerase beta' subunit